MIYYDEQHTKSAVCYSEYYEQVSAQKNTKGHLLPNKSQSTAFMLYTSWRLACNLPVCWGDLWPPNDPSRRHVCNLFRMVQ